MSPHDDGGKRLCHIPGVVGGWRCCRWAVGLSSSTWIAGDGLRVVAIFNTLRQVFVCKLGLARFLAVPLLTIAS